MGHDHLGQGQTDLVVAPGGLGTLMAPDGDVVAETAEQTTRLGQAHLPAVPQELGQRSDGPVSPSSGDPPGPLEMPKPGQEDLDVTVVEG